jgi:hypothetical protein
VTHLTTSAHANTQTTSARRGSTVEAARPEYNRHGDVMSRYWPRLWDVTVHIDLDADRDTYWEPNVWIRHRV